MLLLLLKFNFIKKINFINLNILVKCSLLLLPPIALENSTPEPGKIGRIPKEVYSLNSEPEGNR
jgi:hypothetical protein